MSISPKPPRLPAGMICAKGSPNSKAAGRWSLERVLAPAGAAGDPARRWAGRTIRFVLKKASATADYSVTDEQIKLSKLQGKLFGGSFAGDAQVDNWLHSIPLLLAGQGEEGHGKPCRDHRGSASGEKGRESRSCRACKAARCIFVCAMFLPRKWLQRLSVPAHPLGRFSPGRSGQRHRGCSLEGIVQGRRGCVCSRREPAARVPAAGELPVTAHIQGKYRAASDSLELAQFNLSTPASRVQASGTLADILDAALFRFDFQPGRVAAAGGGAGRSRQPAVPRGWQRHFQRRRRRYVCPPDSGRDAGGGRLRIHHARDFAHSRAAGALGFSCGQRFSSRRMNLLCAEALCAAATPAPISMSAPFCKKDSSPKTTPFTARVNLHNVDVASTAALAGFDCPVSGTADVSLQIIGNAGASPGAGAHSRDRMPRPTERRSRNSTPICASPAARPRSTIFISPTRTPRFPAPPPTRRRRAASALTSKERISTCAQFARFIWTSCPWQGSADFTLQGSGTLDAPEINAAVHVRDLTLDHELSGDLDLRSDHERRRTACHRTLRISARASSLSTAASRCTGIIPRTLPRRRIISISTPCGALISASN